MFGIRGPEWIIIAVIGLLLFGRLPEVARGLGRSVIEFRKGLKGIEDEVETASSKPMTSVTRPPLTSGGADARVSKADIVEQPPADARPSAGGTAA